MSNSGWSARPVACDPSGVCRQRNGGRPQKRRDADRLPSATPALLAPLRLFARLVRNRAQLFDQNSKRNIVVAIELEAEASTQRIFYVSELAGLLRLA